jgi:hypothetical protein
MIISASRRTDIPAFYAEWFMSRIRSGFCLLRNPFRPTQIARVPLDPASVDAIVFWTRNAQPLIPYLAELDGMGYRYYFQYTLVHYPGIFERDVTSVSQKLQRFRSLSQRVGPHRIVWRYDPIVMSNTTDHRYHVTQFETIARTLRGSTSACVISFLDLYRKTERSLDRLRQEKNIGVIDVRGRTMEMAALLRSFSTIARECDLEVTACAEPLDLESLGVHRARCIDAERINRLFGLHLSLEKDKSQRRLCRCVESKDIGAYDTCPYGCIYCYANTSPELAQKNFHRHRSDAPVLI